MSRRWSLLAGVVVAGPLAAGTPLAARAQSPFECSVPSGGSAEASSIATLFPSDVRVTPAQAYAKIGDTCLDFTPFISGAATDKVRTLAYETVLNDGTSVEVSAVFNSDPFINFAVAVTNPLAGVVNYGFSFITGVVGGPYGLATSSGGVTVSRGSAASSTVALGLAPRYLRGWVNGVTTNLGVDIGTAMCVTASSLTCTLPAGAAAFGPLAPVDMRADLGFSLTGNQSVAGWTGRVEIATAVVPEPGTLGLLAAGTVLLGGVAARRRGR